MIKNREKYFKDNGINEVDLELIITEELKRLCIRRGYREFVYIRTAVMWVVLDPPRLQNYLNGILPDLQEEYDKSSTSKAIQAIIRRGVQEACEYTPAEIMESIFGTVFTVEKNISPTEFIGGMADHIYLKLRAKIEGTKYPFE